MNLNSGARPLQRFVTNQVETPIAKLIIAGTIKKDMTVKIDLADDKLVFRY